MPLKWVCFVIALLAVSASWVMTAPIPSDNLPVPIPTRQQIFEIPFRIPPIQDPSETPVNVRLYVSSDRGVNFGLHSTVLPATGKFLFQAPGDGEYWFLLRTVDAANRERPEGRTPELRVIVDTMIPQLELQALRGPSGEIVASWQLSDTNIRPETLKIEYQTTSNPAWHAVAIDRSSPGGGFTRSGSASWVVGSEEIRIRAEVSDIAGNIGRSNAVVRAHDAGAAPQMTGPALTANSSSSGSSSNGGSVSGTSSGTAAQWRPHSSDVPWNRNDAPATSGVATAELPPPASPPVNPSGLPSYQHLQQTQQAANQANQANSSSQTAQSQPPVGQGVTQFSGGAQTPANNQYQYASDRFEHASAQNYDLMLPPGERPRMVSSRSFEMEYEVEAIGPSGIAKVELWGTRDGGRSWRSYGIDPDSRSPMQIQVEDEGLYGFRISVQSGSGLGGTPPQPGDVPEVWVGIDLTKPEGVITGIGPGSGERAGELIIQWRASDNRLASRPVSLYFSPQRNGPWHAIAAGLENTGVYGWRLDNRIPASVYLRLEVRDEAGNITIHDLSDPIPLEQVRPQGRIRNVRPSSNDNAWLLDHDTRRR